MLSLCSSVHFGGTLRGLALIEPFESLALFPDAEFDFAARRGVRAVAVLFSIFPVAFILSAVGPVENAVALLLVVHVLAFIFSAVRPRERALTLHFVIDPRADEHSAISPIVRPVPLDVVVRKVSVVRASVGPGESALAVLLSVNVEPVVLGTVRPCLHALPVLLVLLPVALVLRAVQVAVDTVAVRLVVEPHAVVNVTVRMDEAALAVGLVIAPPSLIHGTVGPSLLALARSNIRAIDPLALELGLVLQDLLRPELQLIIVNARLVAVVELAELLPNLKHFNILVVGSSMVNPMMSGEEATEVGGVAQLIPGEHAAHASLKLDEQEELLAVHCIGDVLDVLEVVPELTRCFLLHRLVGAATSETHILF